MDRSLSASSSWGGSLTPSSDRTAAPSPSPFNGDMRELMARVTRLEADQEKNMMAKFNQLAAKVDNLNDTVTYEAQRAEILEDKLADVILGFHQQIATLESARGDVDRRDARMLEAQKGLEKQINDLGVRTKSRIESNAAMSKDRHSKLVATVDGLQEKIDSVTNTKEQEDTQKIMSHYTEMWKKVDHMVKEVQSLCEERAKLKQDRIQHKSQCRLQSKQLDDLAAEVKGLHDTMQQKEKAPIPRTKSTPDNITKEVLRAPQGGNVNTSQDLENVRRSLDLEIKSQHGVLLKEFEAVKEDIQELRASNYIASALQQKGTAPSASVSQTELQQVRDDMNKLKRGLEFEHNTRFDGLSNRLDTINKTIQDMKTSSYVASKLQVTRFDGLSNRLDTVNKTIQDMKTSSYVASKLQVTPTETSSSANLQKLRDDLDKLGDDHKMRYDCLFKRCDDINGQFLALSNGSKTLSSTEGLSAVNLSRVSEDLRKLTLDHNQRCGRVNNRFLTLENRVEAMSSKDTPSLTHLDNFRKDMHILDLEIQAELEKIRSDIRSIRRSLDVQNGTNSDVETRMRGLHIAVAKAHNKVDKLRNCR